STSMLTSEIIEMVNNAIGVISNILLMYLIVEFSRKEIGSYKYLLLAFASFDVFLCALHSFVKPKIISVGYIFSAATHSLIEILRVGASFAGFFTVPFSLMNIHFAYRYISIRIPEQILMFSDKRVIALAVLYPTAQTITW
ncbi:hypothetical protein PENTCL1PPCAC_16213, partial [Pristionchus entomophagus]